MMNARQHEMRPHDLLKIDTLSSSAGGGADVAASLLFAPNVPSWVATSLAHSPFVVVRRAPRLGDAIPIGVRGSTRGERFGAWIDQRSIASALSPEALLERTPDSDRAHLPAFALLRAISSSIQATGLAWGPAGSTGFELASGTPTVTPESDLDIVIRAPSPLSRDAAAALLDTLSRTAREIGTRIDVQIETPEAAFSLAEFARANLRVMLRHADGPRLVADPWAAA
ncbi:malonate decarboxylase holo-ACP synthase [Caballeronia sp. HLA56]